MLQSIRSYLCNGISFCHHEEWKILSHIIVSGCRLEVPIERFSIKTQESYCILNLRTMEDKCIQLMSRQYDETLSKTHVLFILMMFLKSFLIIFLFLLMSLYKKKEINLLIKDYFESKKITPSIQFLILII